jgi:MoaA/NifB/PqqE/SkfB family radical SAM enzyme
LVVTGGEPFLWRDDGGHSLRDVVGYAKQLGFFRTVICTNGTIELDSQADYLWVSIDGVPSDHDRLRGVGSYDRIVKNVLKSKHEGIYVNYTISSANLGDFEKAVADILRHKKIRGILFHLFTPYVGLENSGLALTGEDRRRAINRIRIIKRKSPLRVSNTFAGLKALSNDDWPRPTWASIVINDGELTECCCRRAIRSPRVCRDCGCTPAVETWVLEKLDATAILENLRFL